MAVIVHGGAYAIPDSIVDASVKGCTRAATEAHKLLKEGRSALDAVEAAVRVLEDDPAFDAGHGSVLNAIGEIEMDAIIMEGRDLKFGAVAGVKSVANPVTLARLVMEKTDHVMLIGEGADKFAREMGIPEVSKEELVSEIARKEWESHSKFSTVVRDCFYTTGNAAATVNGAHCGHDTVGAVALDLSGNVACATSTGGITMKRVGRVGDVPLVGCGGYCDSEVGGASCTGHGESIARVTLARRAVELLRAGVEPQAAVDSALEYMWKRVGGHGGIILVDKEGRIAKGFTTERMAWACVDLEGKVESKVEGLGTSRGHVAARAS